MAIGLSIVLLMMRYFVYIAFFLSNLKPAHHFGIELFTKVGFQIWKYGPSVLDFHVGKTDSADDKS